MAIKVKPIPDGFHSITPYLTVDNAKEAIDFYKRAFDAKETVRMDGPIGKVSHAELKIGDSILMVSDAMPGARTPLALNGTPVNIFLYVEDVDSVFNRARSAGAKVDAPLDDMFWGDRYGKLTDPFGHSWSVAAHKEDVAPAGDEEARPSSDGKDASSARLMIRHKRVGLNKKGQPSKRVCQVPPADSQFASALRQSRRCVCECSDWQSATGTVSTQ